MNCKCSSGPNDIISQVSKFNYGLENSKSDNSNKLFLYVFLLIICFLIIFFTIRKSGT
nr:MAG: hypothetical protein DiTV3a_F12ORF3 [Diabrotica toursvirus 3a]